MHQNVTYGYIWVVGLKMTFFLFLFSFCGLKKISPVSMNYVCNKKNKNYFSQSFVSGDGGC